MFAYVWSEINERINNPQQPAETITKLAYLSTYFGMEYYNRYL